MLAQLRRIQDCRQTRDFRKPCALESFRQRLLPPAKTTVARNLPKARPNRSPEPHSCPRCNSGWPCQPLYLKLGAARNPLAIVECNEPDPQHLRARTEGPFLHPRGVAPLALYGWPQRLGRQPYIQRASGENSRTRSSLDTALRRHPSQPSKKAPPHEPPCPQMLLLRLSPLAGFCFPMTPATARLRQGGGACQDRSHTAAETPPGADQLRAMA